jgi:hypothetical protein
MKNQDINYVKVSISNKPNYSVECTNKSNQVKHIYFYQKFDNQSDKTASLVWAVTEFKLDKNTSFKFSWEDILNFIWQGSGLIQPRVTLEYQGITAAETYSMIDFTYLDDTPLFCCTNISTFEGLKVNTRNNIPKNTFGIGIGMSNEATFLEQALPSKTTSFSCNSSIWIAFGDSIEKGMVLPSVCEDPTYKISFPSNVYSLSLNYTDDGFTTEK